MKLVDRVLQFFQGSGADRKTKVCPLHLIVVCLGHFYEYGRRVVVVDVISQNSHDISVPTDPFELVPRLEEELSLSWVLQQSTVADLAHEQWPRQ